jgi:chromosome segregation ATPase
MSDPRDPHLEVLQGIWGEMKTLNSRVNTTNERLESMERRIDGRLEGIDARLEGIGARLEGIDARLEGIDARLGGIDARLDTMDGRLDLHGRGIVKLIDEVSKLGTRFDNFLGGAHGKEHDELRARVDRLEKHTGLG